MTLQPVPLAFFWLQYCSAAALFYAEAARRFLPAWAVSLKVAPATRSRSAVSREMRRGWIDMSAFSDVVSSWGGDLTPANRGSFPQNEAIENGQF